MPLPDIISALQFLEGVSQEGIEKLAAACKEVTVEAGENFTTQFAPSQRFYLLLSGKVEFSIQLENENDRFTVGTSEALLTPLGWSGFRSPYRYATTDAAVSTCKSLQWEHNDLRIIFDRHPDLGSKFLEFVITHAKELLTNVRHELSEYHISDWEAENLNTEYKNKQISNVPAILDVLRKSPFFEIFTDSMLEQLAAIGKRKRYNSGDVIAEQSTESYGFDILTTGKVSLFHTSNNSGKIALMRTLSNEGYTISWAGALHNEPNDITAIASVDSIIHRFPKTKLHKLLDENPQFNLAFNYRLLWLIGNQLRSARSRLISQKFEKEILAIKNLIEQNCTQLEVSSKLHKVPHLLNNILTIEDAFECLKSLHKSGNTLEKGLATLCLDILGEVYDEHKFYMGLVDVYESVVNAPQSLSSKDIRIRCSEKFQAAFKNTEYVIEGWENLPEEPGHIFIYNHLLNHPYNTLPNNFQLTLDSHFISAMVLYEKYGDPGIRVVRVSRNVEYGHQYYYERLGHINVFTPDSEKVKESEEEKKQRKQEFYSEAGDYLNNGVNLMISPEGTSRRTFESPGQLKAGAFRLAASIEPEPLIVPLSVANFDKRVSHNTLALTVHQPFKISDKLKNKNDLSELFTYLDALKNTYRGYVQESEQAAERHKLKISQPAKLNL